MKQTTFYTMHSHNDDYIESFIDASVLFPGIMSKLFFPESSFRHWNLTVSHTMDFYYIVKQRNTFVFNFLKVVKV